MESTVTSYIDVGDAASTVNGSEGIKFLPD